MADDSPSDDTTAKDLYRQVLEGIGEGALADRENSSSIHFRCTHHFGGAAAISVVLVSI